LMKKDDENLLKLETKLRERGLFPELTHRVNELRKLIQQEQSRPLLTSQGSLTESEILNYARELGVR
jgi:hypothetical protein